MSDQPNLLEGLLEETEYCRQLDISLRTAQRARSAGIAPPHVKIHRRVFYIIDKTRRDFTDRAIEPVRKRARNREGLPAGRTHQELTG